MEMLSWKLVLQGANWSKFKSLAWSIRILQGALPKQPMTKLWLTFHYPTALECFSIRAVNEKTWHSFLKLVQPPSTWESSNHVNLEVLRHKKQKGLQMWKQSAPAVAWLTQLRALLAGCTWIRITLPLVNWRVGDLLENNGLGNNRSACVTSILWIEWLQAFDCCCKWWPMWIDGVNAAVCGHTRVVQDNLAEVRWAQQSKISQHHQQHPTLRPNSIHPRIVWFNGWLTRLRPSTF